MNYFPKPKPFGSGWFDCGCEPREIIICTDTGRSQNEINQCEPPPCESQNFANEGFGQGGFGGFGAYTECGWAATKGWTWWEGNGQCNDYCDVPPICEIPDCDDGYPLECEEVSSFNDGGYDPCSCDIT